MRAVLLFSLLLVPASAGAQAGDELCRAAGGSSGCLDYGRRDGYRPEPSRPSIDPEERAERRAQRQKELEESLRNLEHPRPEPPLSANIPAVLAEDVQAENRVLQAQSGALAATMAAAEVVEALELAVYVESFIEAAPAIIATVTVVEAARQMGWIFAKERKPPEDAWDPNGAKAPGRPPPELGFEDPKSGPTWGQAPNGKWGWVDRKGDIWVPTGHGGTSHRGPHWDVQQKRGGYRNELPPQKGEQ